MIVVRDSYGKTPAEHAAIVTRFVQSQGRDPADDRTMELPGIDAPIPDNVITRIAAGLYEEADDEAPWFVLLLKELSDDEQAGVDFRFRGRFA